MEPSTEGQGKTRFHTALTIAVIVGGAIWCQTATAQIPAYTPQTPTISPWMGLWRQDTGVLDNYHTFVRPQTELNATLQMQNAALNRQAAGLQYLNNELMQPQISPSGMTPTGQGATFMSYSHYYGGNRQPSRAPAPRPTTSRSSPNTPNMPSVPGVQH